MSRPTGRNADPRRAIPLNSSAWRKLREQVLAREPLCRRCYGLGHITPATDVDHVSGDPSDNSRANLQPLCHECHSRKTARERHGLREVYGCDVTGWPLDPEHPWNKKSLATEAERPPVQSSFNADC